MRVKPATTSIVGMLLVMVVLLQGCAGLVPRFEAPAVKVSSLTMLESEGLNQKFKIGLLLSNPNSVALPIAGMSYTLSLNGYDLISGGSSNIPILAAYSETPVTVEASTDLLAALRLLHAMANDWESTLQYQLVAKIDFEGWRPSVNVKRDGLIELSQ